MNLLRRPPWTAIPKRRKASKYNKACICTFYISDLLRLFYRISPRPVNHQDTVSTAQSRAATPPPVAPTSEELDPELTTAPPSEEEILAARRARRQAIMAKYASKESSVAPPSGSSSAVHPPSAPTSLSDPTSQSHSAANTPLVPAIESQGVHADSKLLYAPFYLELSIVHY